MRMWRALFIALALFVAFFSAFYFLGSHPGGERSGVLSTTAWQRMAQPGALSQAHSFLEHNCAACHAAVEGVKASKCIVCHANNESLLQRQPTAINANVSSCRECHHEHRGIDRHPIDMDHVALAEIGLRQLEVDHSPGDVNDLVRKELLDWIDRHEPTGTDARGHSSLDPQAAVLDCATCHSTKDVHRELFGQDCAQCHATAKWTIPEYRHPSPNSTDCAQCHQAPPSHYMMHFKMISAKFARQPSAKVNECYQCHQTTSWNDIKGVGFYKHH